MTAALRFENLTLGYNRHPAVHHLDAEIARGALTAIVGPNGAGKSTLLKGVAGALRPLEGRMTLADSARTRIAYLPQLAEIDRSFPVAVLEFVAMGLWRRIGAFGALGRGDRDRLGAALSAVGLEGFERRSIGALSGGQTQRALFARLLLQDAELILLDEPFTAIDARTAADLMDLVRRWHGEGRTVVAVLHDLDLVRAAFPETLLLARELVAHGPTKEALSAANLLRARRMIEAQDDAAAVCRRSGAR
ncbi:zinc ABC transporter ATP-binding protein AztA, partial [Rubrimonas sp.]|uniref:zinc ABC transporter ATP-binding protein AztA n=1 Tax=Rubrimonas sp. TaxID=2036015 RepID=UPI002FDDCA30